MKPSSLSGSPWLIGIWRLRPFVRMVNRCAAPLTASPSASATASANRVHRADALVRLMRGSYNDFVQKVSDSALTRGARTQSSGS